MTVAIDHRCLVRIWTPRTFNLIDQRRVEEGQRPIDVVKALVREALLAEAVATADWDDGSRWSGFVYISNGHLEVMHHDEVKRLLEWPQFDNLGPAS